ncbi:MAG: hypothetical protein ABEJ98_02000 [Candidatus Nanohaloarchaea archaeon]
MLETNKWERKESLESESRPRVWKHGEEETTVKVERFEDGTWDALRDDRVIENFDSAEEAIERGKDFMSS